VLSGPAVENFKNSSLDELVVSDTIPLRPTAAACEIIRQVSVAGLVAETMWRIHIEESVSSLFL
jgi:ribose-phosphate pyrophosphokinase